MILAARPLALGLTLLLLALVGSVLAVLPAVSEDGPAGARMLPGLEAPPWLSRESWIEDRDVDVALLSGGPGFLAVARFPGYARLSRLQWEERVHRLLPPPGAPVERRVGHVVLEDAVFPALETRYSGPRGRVVEVLLAVDTGEANPMLLVARSPEPEALEAMFQGISLEGPGLAVRD